MEQVKMQDRVNHADLCFDADFTTLFGEAYRRDVLVADLLEAPEFSSNPDEYDDPVDCFKCGGDPYNCHHMDDYWKERELALKERHI